MKAQAVHPHIVRWGVVIVGLVLLTILLLMAKPAAQKAPIDQPAPPVARQLGN